MDRKSVARWSLGCLAASLVGCQTDVVADARFDGPAGAAVLDGETGPFTEPVGFVANSRNGRIFGLDLKRAMHLVIGESSPFYPVVPIPTGQSRLLGDMVAWAPDDQRVTLFAADAASASLLEVPYVVGVTADGAPVAVTPTVSEPVFVDADGSGDSASLLDLDLRTGYTTTEDWTITFDGEFWRATGSASGPQEIEFGFLQAWASDFNELELMIGGTATAGDQITLSTETGVVEHDLGGSIQALHHLVDRGAVLASVYDLDTDDTRLVVFDLATRAATGEIALPAGATPWRMATDAAGERLFVADARDAAVYRVALDPDDLTASAAETLDVRGAVADVAWQGDDEHDHLFVAVAAENRVDLYDLAAEGWLDVNPWTPEIDGMVFESPITGLASSTDPVRLLETSDETGERVTSRVVAVSTFKGLLYMMESETGCLAQDDVGPYGYADSSDPFSDQAPASNPELVESDSSGLEVQVNTCGGLARSESWTVTFDGTEGNWVVEGTLSGEQVERAWENTRYVSDNGAISFLILSGQAPSTAGDQFALQVDRGVAVVDGDLDGNGSIENPLELPARPVPFSYLAGATGGGWDEVNRKVDVLWPITNDDTVLRVNLQSTLIEVVWD